MEWIDFNNLQRRHANGQQEHKKMFNITSHQETVNLNHNDILLHTFQDGNYEGEKKKKRCWQDVKKLEVLYTIGGNGKWYTCFTKQKDIPQRN